MIGFVRLPKEILGWDYYADPVVRGVYIHLLLTMRFTDGSYQGLPLQAGQAIIGRRALAEKLGFSEQQIRTALRKLESCGLVRLKSTNRFTVATIENWRVFQGASDGINQQSTSDQPHLKKINIYIDVPEELKPAFMEFVAMRERIKKPLTSKESVNRQIAKLRKLGETEEEQIAILHQSVDNCWQGLFPLRGCSTRQNLAAQGEVTEREGVNYAKFGL